MQACSAICYDALCCNLMLSGHESGVEALAHARVGGVLFCLDGAACVRVCVFVRARACVHSTRVGCTAALTDGKALSLRVECVASRQAAPWEGDVCPRCQAAVLPARVPARGLQGVVAGVRGGCARSLWNASTHLLSGPSVQRRAAT
jgi:hypothetical protein